jgi:hypothetical protein
MEKLSGGMSVFSYVDIVPKSENELLDLNGTNI